jgi:hypothetical protein
MSEPTIHDWLRLRDLNQRNREACDRLEREAAEKLAEARCDLDLVAGAIKRGELPVLAGGASR